jgi:hypothetical protein
MEVRQSKVAAAPEALRPQHVSAWLRPLEK